MGWLSTAASLTKIAGGLFGKKEKTPTPAENMVSQAKGAREASEKYGFNPLTMLQYGQPGGALGGGGTPPLASFEMLADGLDALSPERRADEALQREQDRLNLELAKVKLEQARSGVVLVPSRAVDSVGQGAAPLGRAAATVVQGGALDAGYSSRSAGGDPLRAAGVTIEKDRAWSDAQDFEQRYGDIGGEIAGVAIMGADANATMKRDRLEERPDADGWKGPWWFRYRKAPMEGGATSPYPKKKPNRGINSSPYPKKKPNPYSSFYTVPHAGPLYRFH